jgi:acyl-CoA thioesterase
MSGRDLLHPYDLELVDLDVDDDGRSGRFTLTKGLVRHDGALYGGTGLCASVMAMEAATGRDVLWATTQFVSSPREGSEVTWTTEVLAEGKRASQVLVRASAEGQVAFVATGSVGIAKDDGLTGQWRSMPEVTPPEESATWGQELSIDLRERGWGLHIDLRSAKHTGDGTAHRVMWARRHDGRPFTPAAIAFAADFVPLGIAAAAGKMGAGSSLDNSLRFKPGETTEWILLEVTADFALGGFGHGEVAVWGSDGDLRAVGSQSASMRYVFSEGEPDPRPGMQRTAQPG